MRLVVMLVDQTDSGKFKMAASELQLWPPSWIFHSGSVKNYSCHSHVCLCSRLVTVAASHARGSGFNSRSRQAWLRPPSFRGQWNKQQLLNSGWLLSKIANVNHRSKKSAGHASWATWKLISPVDSWHGTDMSTAPQILSTKSCSWSARNLHYSHWI